mgnify:CR=1 FL=1
MFSGRLPGQIYEAASCDLQDWYDLVFLLSVDRPAFHQGERREHDSWEWDDLLKGEMLELQCRWQVEVHDMLWIWDCEWI